MDLLCSPSQSDPVFAALDSKFTQPSLRSQSKTRLFSLFDQYPCSRTDVIAWLTSPHCIASFREKIRNCSYFLAFGQSHQIHPDEGQ
jgi:hypothetical protein